jgi:hypothetical protein
VCVCGVLLVWGDVLRESVCVCVYVWVCVCFYVCVYVWVCVSFYIRVYVCVCVCFMRRENCTFVHLCVYVCICVRICACVRSACTCAYECVRVCMYARMYPCVYVRGSECMHKFTHTRNYHVQACTQMHAGEKNACRWQIIILQDCITGNTYAHMPAHQCMQARN